ncbi:glycosyl hydrolase family 61-domain-containing protein [Aspergillus cavernicola]|uniref:AA9 family lytic polysaccharide monooxygenase n=1 Tax=Aspergillus cavernicola TaxID=176166 RepID=A0ABR4HUB8_9EURO
MKSTILIPLLTAATQTAAHGYVSNLVINGVYFRGWNPSTDPYSSSPPIGVGWETPNLSNGFVTPDEASTDSIICHINATNPRGYATVAAGDEIYLQWVPTPWPDSHHGPVLDYLANCGESCETVDKTSLEFFKISGPGLIDGSSPPGIWADDQLIANGNGWLVQIPASIAPGNYVLRHEIIALHGAGSENGAQLYPQCFNLVITGSGNVSPSGVAGPDLYTPTDPGILINIYQVLTSYIVPGPALIPQASSIVQSSSAITATGTPTPGGTTTTTSSTLTTTTSSTTTTTTTTATTTTGGSGTSTQTLWGQCGGSGWTGATACPAAATCTSYSDFYSQCIPS